MTQYNRVLDDGVMILPSLLLNGSRIVQTHEADVSKHSLTRYLYFLFARCTRCSTCCFEHFMRLSGVQTKENCM